MNAPWLHTSPAFPPNEWSAGWTDATGPDFSDEPASAGQTLAVADLVEAVGLKNASWAKQAVTESASITETLYFRITTFTPWG